MSTKDPFQAALDKLENISEKDTRGYYRITNPVVKMFIKLNSESPKIEARHEDHIIEVDPNRTRMWEFAARTVSDEDLDIEDLKLSMLPGQEQLIPALARKVTGEPGIDYELIYGRRRRAACIYHKRKLVIKITEDNDEKCFWYMDIENHCRK